MTRALFGLMAIGLVSVTTISCVSSANEASGAVSTNSNPPPKHPVTTLMETNAAKLSLAAAPEFTAPTVKGEAIRIGGTRDKPQFVLFILDECPCSVDAQPIFNAFSKHWSGKIDFVGVINVDGKKASTWVGDYKPIFPVATDPKMEIIRAYGAKQSVYSALVTPEGKIVKLWPGYSRDMLVEMNKKMSDLVGEQVRFFDSQYAPTAKTSGCKFAP